MAKALRRVYRYHIPASPTPEQQQQHKRELKRASNQRYRQSRKQQGGGQ